MDTDSKKLLEYKEKWKNIKSIIDLKRAFNSGKFALASIEEFETAAANAVKGDLSSGGMLSYSQASVVAWWAIGPYSKMINDDFFAYLEKMLSFAKRILMEK
jgi:hypothetical protein